MRFMVMVKATPQSEAGEMPGATLLEDMGRFNEELVKAGVLLAGEGLHPSVHGARIRYAGKRRQVIEGPFHETSGLVAGFWLLELKSMEEAIEWMKRCPNPGPGETEVEIRRVFEANEFADMSPELREREAAMRDELRTCFPD